MRRKWLAAGVVSVLLVVQGCLSMAWDGQVVRVAWFEKPNSEYYNAQADPSQGTSEDDMPGVYGGYDYEYLRMVAQMTGWKYQFVRGSLKESLDRLQRGDVDLVCSLARLPEREALFAYTDNSYGPAGVELLVPAGNTTYAMNDYASFSGMRVGLVPGSNADHMTRDFCERYHITMQPVFYDQSQKAIDAMRRGEVDGIVDGVTLAIPDCKILAHMQEQKVYFVGNKDNPELIRELDEAIARIQYLKPGYTEALSNKYFYAQSTNSLSLSSQERAYLEQRLAAGQPIVVTYDPKWMPIEYKDPKTGEMKGIMAEVFARISAMTGLQFKFVAADSYAETLRLYGNQADVAATISTDFEWADEHADYLTQSVFDMPVYVVFHPDGEEEKGPVVAVTKGYHLAKAVQKWLSKAGENVRFSYYDTVGECMEAVRSGQADRTYVNAYELNYYINQERFENLKIQSVPGFSEPTSIGVSKEADPLLFAVLCQALRAISPADINSMILDNTSVKAPRSLTALIYADPLVSMGVASVVVFLLAGLLFFYFSNRHNKALRQQLELANQVKNDFLSRMNHDIRTPMNAIIGLTDIIRRKHYDPELQSSLDKIDESSRFLLHLINDILDISQIENRDFTLHLEPYALTNFVSFVKNTIGPLAQAKGVAFTIEEDGSLPVILTDRLRFNQAFLNLLSNAVKFTPAPGRVYLLIGHRAEGKGRQRLQITVQDTGIGMSKEFLPRIFRPFDQENERHIGLEQGSGLGLAVVKRIVDAFGGTISVQSKKGEGSTFIVEFSADLALPEAGEAACPAAALFTADSVDAETAAQTLRGRHILIVEDNAINQEVARAQLEAAGMICVLAGNGAEALQLFQESPLGYYDALLMDIRMPVMDGKEASRRLRRLARHDSATVPIIALTADVFDGAQQEVLDCGMTAYLAKPVYPDELYAVLLQTVGKTAL